VRSTSRVLNEIRYKVLRKPSDYVALVLFIVLVLLMYALYIVPSLNSAEASLAGLSKAFSYSLIVWILIMATVVYAALTSWR